MNKKLLISIFALIFLALGGVYMFQRDNSPQQADTIVQSAPNEDITTYEPLAFPDNTLDTSDWQTYRSEEFGFEVRYPRGWSASWQDGPCSTAGYGVGYVSFSPEAHTPNDDNGTEICLERKNIEEEKRELVMRGWEEKRRIQVNNAYGTAFSFRNPEGKLLNGEAYVLADKDVLFNFTDMGGKYTSIFQQILLSFKLTK